MELKPSEALDLAKLHRKQGRFGEAKFVLEKIVETDPGHAEALFELARVARDIGKLEISVNFMLQSLEKNETSVEVYAELSDVHLQLDNFEIAEEACRRALELQPGNLKAQMNLGKSLFELRRHRESVEAFQEAVKGRPKFAEGYFKLARALSASDRLKEAAVAYRRALQIDPGKKEALNNLANIYLQQKKPARAISLVRQLLKRNPDYANAHYCLSLAKRFQPEDPDIQEFERVAELPDLSDVDQSLVRFALGKAYRDIGAHEKAFAHYVQGNAIMKALSNDYDPACEVEDVERIICAENSVELPRADSVDETTIPVFVTGLSRSGKTLIESLAATHEQVLAAGERNYFAQARREVTRKAGITEPFPECNAKFDTQLLNDLAKAYLERVRDLRRNNETHIVNTIPANYIFGGLIMRAMPNAKIILCERDRRDHMLRIFFTRYQRKHEYAYDLRDIAWELECSRRLFSHWRDLYGDRILTVKYEVLVTSPRPTIERVTDFLGLERLPAKVTKGIHDREVGHWRHYERYLGEYQNPENRYQGSDKQNTGIR